jgi:hypothetical protein
MEATIKPIAHNIQSSQHNATPPPAPQQHLHPAVTYLQPSHNKTIAKLLKNHSKAVETIVLIN